jgi:hypothetical protein
MTAIFLFAGRISIPSGSGLVVLLIAIGALVAILLWVAMQSRPPDD